MAPELSIGHLIANASFFVQLIMLTLFAMFLTTLFITGKKIVQFKRLNIKRKKFEQAFWSGTALQTLYEEYENQRPEALASLFVHGFYEFGQFRGNNLNEPDMIVKNCRRAMEAAACRESAEQESWLNVLATFGSSAPYIGLLGTVYGIMTSFIGLGAAHQTSINSVAPGIAEALIATAIGLIAAIPSVLSYNYFINKSEALNTEYDAFIEEFSNLLQRQILVAREHIKHR